MVTKKKGIPTLWNDVLQSLHKKNAPICKPNITHDNGSQRLPVSQKKIPKKRSQKRKRYYLLDGEYKSVYFTKREVETLRLLLQNKTVVETARVLHLSPRTIEFYVKNLRRKLNCSTKKELVKWVLNTDFLKNSKGISKN